MLEAVVQSAAMWQMWIRYWFPWLQSDEVEA